MTTKFLLIDHKIKIFKEELENVKNTFINIKTLQFMESKEILCSLATVEELRKKGIPVEGETNIKNLVFQRETYIPLKLDKSSSKKKDKEENIPKNINFFCYSISNFIQRFIDYYKLIYEELKQFSLDIDFNNVITPQTNNSEPLAGVIETRAKQVLNEYMELVANALDESGIFDPPQVKRSTEGSSFFRETISEERISTINKNEEEIKDIPSECKQSGKKAIYNFILKDICVKLSHQKAIKEDIVFHSKCISLSWIEPENLDISNEIVDESIFEKIIYHINRMDKIRTPEDILNEFGLAVQLINSLYIFMSDRPAEANDLLPVIIYLIIKARPKRMIFNLKYISFFFDDSNLKGALGYNLIQAKSAVKFINQLGPKETKLSEQEFKKKCSEVEKLEKSNNRAAPLPI